VIVNFKRTLDNKEYFKYNGKEAQIIDNAYSEYDSATGQYIRK
jgi:hypothetical protein